MKKIFSTVSIFFVFVAGFYPVGALSFKKEISFSKTNNETPVNKIVKRIAKANVYTVTPTNTKIVSDQELNYVDLLKIASIEELTQLAKDHKNAVVRLYAFRALMEMVKDAPKDIFEQFSKDSTPVRVVNGTSSEMKPLNSISNGFLY